MKFYFNCNNSTQADLLREVGVKHIMISYKYVKTPYEGFESIMATPGSNADPFKYYDWVKEQGDNITALQWDDPTNIENNKIWFDKASHLGVIPVIHGDWFRSIQKGEFKDDQLIALGNLQGKIEEDETLKKLPTKYRYHGLGKGRWTKNNNLTSVDSSTWLSGVRGRKTDVFQRESLVFGKKGQGDKGRIQIAVNYHKSFAKKVCLDVKELQAGEYSQLMKASFALYYMPMFKSLDIYESNFSS